METFLSDNAGDNIKGGDMVGLLAVMRRKPTGLELHAIEKLLDIEKLIRYESDRTEVLLLKGLEVDIREDLRRVGLIF